MTQPVTIQRVGAAPRLFVWKVNASPATDTGRWLMIVHGAGEHSGRYTELAQSAAARGWNVVASDLRGHGCSEGPAVHIKRFDDYARDLAAVADGAELDWSRTAILAHSLGGLITLRGCQQGLLRPHSVALSNPLLRIRARIPQWKLILGRISRQFRPKQRFRSTVKIEHLLSDPDARRRRLEDPLINRTLTAAWFYQVRSALKRVWRDPHDLPTLVVQGLCDKVVDPRAAAAWLRREDAPNSEGLFLPGRRHEFLHEPEGPEFADRMLAWLEARVPHANFSDSDHSEILPMLRRAA